MSIRTALPAAARSRILIEPCNMPRGVFDFNDPRSQQRRRLSVHECHSACNFDPLMECAPDGDSLKVGN
jgi:hypothetical protein